MNLFNFFKKKKPEEIDITVEQEVETKVDYSGLIDITKILTENDAEATEAIHHLVDNPSGFEQRFNEWLYEYDFSPEHQPDIITAFILTGSNVDSPYDFGGYIDWKEEGNEVLWSLKPGIVNKKYPIVLDDIEFLNDECGQDAIEIIDSFLKNTEYLLVIWDVNGDCYNLFIIPKSKWQRLQELGRAMKIKFWLVESAEN